MFNVIKLFSLLLKLPTNKRVFVPDKPLQYCLLESEVRDKSSSLFEWSVSNKGMTLTLMFNVIKLFSSLLKLQANKRVFVLDKPLQSSLLLGSDTKDKCSSLFASSISNKGITLTPNVQCYKTFFFVTVALVNKLECLSLNSLYNLV